MDAEKFAQLRTCMAELAADLVNKAKLDPQVAGNLFLDTSLALSLHCGMQPKDLAGVHGAG